MPVRTGLPQHVVDGIIKNIPEQHRTVGEINYAITAKLGRYVPNAKRMQVTTLSLVDMFIKEHLTLREIAFKVGLSATAIGKRLKSAGVDTTDGTWVKRQCGFCSKPMSIRRCKARLSPVSYCNTKCSGAAHSSPGSYEWRHGTRLARVIVQQFFDLQPEHIVHHKDRDELNVDRANLCVFASQSDHLKFHHGKSRVEPIWDGSLIEARGVSSIEAKAVQSAERRRKLEANAS